MNHGGIGYLDYQCLTLPTDLLRPLSIADGSSVMAMHYPVMDDPDYRDVPDCHDLMLTPVPRRYWPAMARLFVRLRHRRGAMAKVAAWFRNRQVSILNAECSRSAHRYATWNLTIAFDSLVGQTNPFDARKSENVGTALAIQSLLQDLEHAFGDDVLFRDVTDPGLAMSVEGLPVRAHSYFDNYLNSQTTPPTAPFELYCSHGQLHSRDEQLAALLNRLEDHGQELAPTCVFAEMDTRDFNIRVAIIPPQRLERFFEVVIPYRRFSGDSTRGLVATLTHRLSARYNIWRAFNSISQNGLEVEAGSAVLCLEDCSNQSAHSESRRTDLRLEIDHIRHELPANGPIGTKILREFEVHRITPELVRSRLIRDHLRNSGVQFDVFISYSTLDGRDEARRIAKLLEKQGLRPYLDENELAPGDDWHDRLFEGMQVSAEVAVVCTPGSSERPWVAVEVGCALGLDKKVTGILCEGVKQPDIPAYLRRFQCVDLHNDPQLATYGNWVQRRIARR